MAAQASLQEVSNRYMRNRQASSLRKEHALVGRNRQQVCFGDLTEEDTDVVKPLF